MLIFENVYRNLHCDLPRRTKITETCVHFWPFSVVFREVQDRPAAIAPWHQLDFDEYGFSVSPQGNVEEFYLPGSRGKRHPSTLMETTLYGRRRTHVWVRQSN